MISVKALLREKPREHISISLILTNKMAFSSKNFNAISTTWQPHFIDLCVHKHDIKKLFSAFYEYFMN